MGGLANVHAIAIRKNPDRPTRSANARVARLTSGGFRGQVAVAHNKPAVGDDQDHRSGWIGGLVRIASKIADMLRSSGE